MHENLNRSLGVSMSKRYIPIGCIAALLIGVCTGSFAQSTNLNDAYAAAIARDKLYAILNLTLESKRISAERANLSDVLSFATSLDAALAPLALSGDSITTAITITPGIDLGLPEPMTTNVSVDVPITISQTDGTSDVGINPGLSVSQPLNKLLGLEPSERAKKLAQLVLIEQARIDLISREIAVKKNVLSSIRGVAVAKLNFQERTRALDTANRDLEMAKSLGELNPLGIQFKRIELAVTRATRVVEAAELALVNANERYERITGSTLIPELRELSGLDFPSEGVVEKNASVYLATLLLERASAELELLEAPFIPRFSVGASYAMSGELDDPGHAIGGSVSAVFENFSITAGLSSSVATNASNNADTLSGSIGFRLSFPDGRSDDLAIAAKKNSLEIGRLELEQAITAYRDRLDGLLVKRDEISTRTLVLSEDREMASQNLGETNERMTYGLTSDIELDSATWSLEKLDIVARLIVIDTYVLSLDIAALTLVE